jgi:hypothetical protein
MLTPLCNTCKLYRACFFVIGRVRNCLCACVLFLCFLHTCTYVSICDEGVCVCVPECVRVYVHATCIMYIPYCVCIL